MAVHFSSANNSISGVDDLRLNDGEIEGNYEENNRSTSILGNHGRADFLVRQQSNVVVDEKSNHHSGNPANPEPSARLLDNEESIEAGSNSAMATAARSADRGDEVDANTGLHNDGDVSGLRTDSDSSIHKARADESKSKTIANQTEAEWLKSILPEKLEGSGAGYWAVKNSGAGFDVDFRVRKPKLNLSFPYVSREVFTTWKGLTNGEAKRKAAIYVGSHLRDAIERGEDKARIVAGKLSNLA